MHANGRKIDDAPSDAALDQTLATLLPHAYLPPLDDTRDAPRAAFRADLLARLKTRQARRRAPSAAAPAAATGEPADERLCRVLLQNAYTPDVPHEPRPEFRVSLLMRLQRRLNGRRAPATPPNPLVPPGTARTASTPWRSLFLAAAGGAAAMFALLPALPHVSPARPAAPFAMPGAAVAVARSADGAAESVGLPFSPAAVVAHGGRMVREPAAPDLPDFAVPRVAPSMPSPAAFPGESPVRLIGQGGGYAAPSAASGLNWTPLIPETGGAAAAPAPRLDPDALAFFPPASMPEKLRTGGIEWRAEARADDDAAATGEPEWRLQRATGVIPLDPASTTAWRAVAGTANGRSTLSGFAYPDNSVNALLEPDSEMAATPEGFRLVKGRLRLEVRPGAPRAFPLVLEDQAISVEPGSFLMATVADPAGYAPGGTPAPEVLMGRRSLAYLKTATGVAPLYPERLYRVDRYVSREAAGSPVMSAACGAATTAAGETPAGAAAGDATAGYRWDGDRLLTERWSGEPTEAVRRFSRTYLELLRRDRSLAGVLALGTPTVVESEGVFYAISD